MAYDIVLENESATIRYEPKLGYIYHTFHKAQTGAPFRNIMNAALDYLIEHKGSKWLSDDRLNAAFNQEDVVYAVTDWGPRAAKGGWKFWALVVPADIAGRASMQDIVETFYDMGVRVSIFSDLDKAREWIESAK